MSHYTVGGPGDDTTVVGMKQGIPMYQLYGEGKFVPSVPSPGNYPVTNLYVTTGGKLEVQYDDAVAIDKPVVSEPPEGGQKVLNLYVDATTQKLLVEVQTVSTKLTVEY